MTTRSDSRWRWLVAPALAGLVALVGCGDAPTGNDGLDEASTVASHQISSGESVDLLAAQDVDVGEVTVTDDGTDLTVKITTTAGWCLQELHLDAADEEKGIPQNRRGNPTPGRFQISEALDCQETELSRTLALPEPNDGDVAVAVHTVVEEVPFPGGEVTSSSQGVKKNGNDIGEERSDPTAALTKDYPEGEFFSLGFKPDGEGGSEDHGGSVEVELACAIEDGEGDDFRIWEVTFAPYPEENADVYAWDGSSWVLLGTADNSDQGPRGTSEAHTVSGFDLADGGLSSTARLRIVDATDPSIHNSRADAFDVDGIQVVNGDCSTRNETAWADGERFVDRGNWATYLEYTP